MATRNGGIRKQGRDRDPACADSCFAVAGRLGVLTTLARSLASVEEVSQVVEVAAQAARRGLNARLVSVLEYVPAAGRLRVLVNHGDLRPGEERRPDGEWYTPTDRGMRAAGEPPEPWTAAAGDEAADPRSVISAKSRDDRNTLIAPIFFSGRVWGKLYVARDAGAPFYGRADVEFATTLAALVSAGLAQVGHREQLAGLAFTDPLTGLANRRALEGTLGTAMDSHRLSGRPLALIICDVNGLKQVNDRDGHDAGDAVLRAVAFTLAEAARRTPDTLAARLGGDEFCILLTGQSVTAAKRLAATVAKTTANVPGIAGLSVGLAATDGPTGAVSSWQELLRLADAAQYDAKHHKRAVPVVAGPRHLHLLRAQDAPGTAKPRRRIRD